MQTSPHGLEHIKLHEGLRLDAYQDPVGVWTIGWGHTRDVRRGDEITMLQADSFLLSDVAEAEKCIRRHVRVPLTQGQFDALVSFIFNFGCPRFLHSTLLRLLNGFNHAAAALEFPRWTKAGGKELAGLVRRRKAEQEMFLEVRL